MNMHPSMRVELARDRHEQLVRRAEMRARLGRPVDASAVEQRARARPVLRWLAPWVRIQREETIAREGR